jgi:capsule polysaccharide export protein KpsE/RkpR
MVQNIDRSMADETKVGQEVVTGLENTLAWIRSQFDMLRSDVEEHPATKALSASASSDYIN